MDTKRTAKAGNRPRRRFKRLPGAEERRAIGERLVRVRLSRNLTQERLAERLGERQYTVSRWERGDTLPRLGTLLALREILEVSIDFLLTGEPGCERSRSAAERT